MVYCPHDKEESPQSVASSSSPLFRGMSFKMSYMKSLLTSLNVCNHMYCGITVKQLPWSYCFNHSENPLLLAVISAANESLRCVSRPRASQDVGRRNQTLSIAPKTYPHRHPLVYSHPGSHDLLWRGGSISGVSSRFVPELNKQHVLNRTTIRGSTSYRGPPHGGARKRGNVCGVKHPFNHPFVISYMEVRQYPPHPAPRSCLSLHLCSYTL